MKHMTADIALELIEGILRLYREEHMVTTIDDGGNVSERLESSRPPASDRSLPARAKYSLQVGNGNVLNQPHATPSQVKILECLKGKRDVTMKQLVEGTGLQASTISNYLVILRKQGILRSDAIR
jgi:predicted HTH transcriptional regulator